MVDWLGRRAERAGVRFPNTLVAGVMKKVGSMASQMLRTKGRVLQRAKMRVTMMIMMLVL